MNIRFNYFETVVRFESDKVFSIEIENKGNFYRCISDFVIISNGENSDDIYCFDDNNEENILTNKLIVVSDYFNFGAVLKRYSNSISKLICSECDALNNNKLTSDYKNLRQDFMKYVNSIDLPININDDFSIDSLIKLLKPTINVSNNLLNNLCILIELEKMFSLNKMLVFVNLKQYLSKNEILEFYKYAVYNNIKILLLDSQSYGPTLDYEKKIIVDENLDEFVL